METKRGSFNRITMMHPRPVKSVISRRELLSCHEMPLSCPTTPRFGPVSMESVIATIPLKCACIYKFFEKDIFSREVTEGKISTPHQKHAGFAGYPRERGRQCIGNLPIQAPSKTGMSGSLPRLPGALSIFLPSSEVSKDKKQLLAGSLGQCFLSLTPESLTFQATPKRAKSTHLPMAGGNCIHFLHRGLQ